MEKQGWDFNDVLNLKVNGTLSEYDVRTLGQFKNLFHLDLSGSQFETISGLTQLIHLRDVTLPTTVTRIENETFKNCYRLNTINTENITYIGNEGFRGCSELTTPDLSKVTYIGNNGFQESGLVSADVSKASYLGESAFQSCSHLSSIKLCDELTELSGYTFSDCSSLESISLPSNLKRIGGGVFQSTSALKSLEFPEGFLECRDGENFVYSGIENLIFPSTTINIGSCGDWATYAPNLKNLTIKSIVPPEGDGVKHMPNGVKLHLPHFCLEAYTLNDNYKIFSTVAIKEDVDALFLPGDFTLNEHTGLAQTFDLTIGAMPDDYRNNWAYSSFTSNLTETMTVRDLTLNAHFGTGSYWTGNGYINSTLPAVLSKGDITAQTATINAGFDYNTDSGKWHFISFPFDVRMQDITPDPNSLWVIREYDGDARASLGENTSDDNKTWKNLTMESTLVGGKGYILQCRPDPNASNPRDFVKFSLNASGSADGINRLMSAMRQVVSLVQHKATEPHNENWNLVGNPYLAYYDIANLGFEGPVTVYNANERRYESYVPGDDSYTLRPMEAFFVQALTSADGLTDPATGYTGLTFNPEGKCLTQAGLPAAAPRRNVRRADDGRHIVNILLEDGANSDRTRLVLNEAASAAYELGRDAAKFMAMDPAVPQIYMIEQGVRLAIDERPAADGEFRLGTTFGTSGLHTISLREETGVSVELVDLDNGRATLLNDTPYTFQANAGTRDDRFMLRLSQTGIDSVAGDTASPEIAIDGNRLTVNADSLIEVFSIDGSVAASGYGTVEADLESGLYLVRTSLGVSKIMIR